MPFSPVLFPHHIFVAFGKQLYSGKERKMERHTLIKHLLQECVTEESHGRGLNPHSDNYTHTHTLGDAKYSTPCVMHPVFSSTVITEVQYVQLVTYVCV